MTAQEVTTIRSFISNGFEFRKELAIANGKEYTIEELNRIVGVADEALKKQESQKVEKTILHFDGEYYKCPVCENLLSEKQNYCDECGQKLLWEDSK